MNRSIFIAGSVVVSLTGCGLESQNADQRPNVIVIMTDDQGIANLSCLGNEYIETPNIDKFYEESVRLTDFHVCPLSTPTRSSIISGEYPIRNGAWATFKGRDVLSFENPTIADAFLEAGYSTAQFGKWHLGDNYPSRATDRGFEYAVQHSSGGVGELSDYWGNSYFDDTYLVNNVPTQFEGYCTDVWFSEAQKYISKQSKSGKPFFIYLATNAPHSPHYAPEEYTKLYEPLAEQGIIKDAGYYGQIKNIDDNFGKFDEYLKKSGLADNTIVIFLTDNGAPPANNPWTMGYRGGKSSQLEGGHRVPFFIRWYKGGVAGGVDIDGLASHVDLMPTLTKMCGIELGERYKTDGIDISDAILREGDIPTDRTLFIHHRQDYRAPFDVNKSVIMRDKWRLLNGTELYDVEADRAQLNNVANQYPELVESLLAENSEFVEQTKRLEAYQKFIPSVVDPSQQSVTTLTIQHAVGPDPGLWMPEQIAEGVRNRNNGYEIYIPKAGTYTISMARWPRECQGPIWGLPDTNPKDMFDYKIIRPQYAILTIDGIEKANYRIIPTESEVSLRLWLTEGRHFIETDFVDQDGKFGVYYTYVEKAAY